MISARDPSARPDDDLVRRLQAGEDTAFEELVRLHGPRMLAVARRYLPGEADAEDAVQDAFVSVARSIGAFEGGSRLSTWLHRVVVNAALMRIRARGRRPERSADDATLEAATGSASRSGASCATTEGASKAELRSLVREEIDRLSEPHRIVLVLRDLDGMDLDQIAVVLGIGLTTVKMRLHHGRRALRAALEPRLAPSKTS
jgi:RNA polymerase sigma-70 factor (ECF subfamily)